MLFLLRKLRKSFFLPGKLRTYMAYALGEIVLIVVGILIAVQIGDWKEAGQQRIEIELALSDIKADLEKEASSLNELLAELERRQTAVEALKAHFEGKAISNTNMEKHFGQLTGYSALRPVRSSYAAFKDSGLPLNNRHLKLTLIDYFEEEQVSVVDIGADYEWFFKTHHLPFQRKHMEYAEFEEIAIPRDHSDPALKDDFLVNTFDFDTLIGLSLSRSKELLELNNEIQELIDAELTGDLD